MTGRYEGQQPNTEQDGEKLLRIMAMAAKAAGAQQVPRTQDRQKQTPAA